MKTDTVKRLSLALLAFTLFGSVTADAAPKSQAKIKRAKQALRKVNRAKKQLKRRLSALDGSEVATLNSSILDRSADSDGDGLSDDLEDGLENRVCEADELEAKGLITAIDDTSISLRSVVVSLDPETVYLDLNGAAASRDIFTVNQCVEVEFRISDPDANPPVLLAEKVKQENSDDCSPGGDDSDDNGDDDNGGDDNGGDDGDDDNGGDDNGDDDQNGDDHGGDDSRD